MKYFFLTALLSFSSFAATETLCSPRDISSFDPARIEDDIAGRIMLNFAPMLLKPNGAPGEIVKSISYLNGDLSIELRDDLEWQGNEHFKPTKKLNADDVIETFLRTDQDKNSSQYIKYDFISFKSKVRQHIKSIKKVSETVLILTFEAGADYKKILSRPQAAIISKEYLDVLNKKMNLDLIKTHPVFLKGTTFNYGNGPKSFSVSKKGDAFDFQLGLTDSEIKSKLKNQSCVQILELPSTKAKEFANTFGYLSVPARSRMTMFIMVNPFTAEGQDPVFRKLISDVVSSVETPSTIRQLEPKKLFSMSKTSTQLIKDSGNSKYMGPRYLFAYTYGNSFVESGRSEHLEKLKAAFFVTNFDMRFFLLSDGGFLKNLSHGGYHVSIYSTDNLEALASCWRSPPFHPLQTCGKVDELKKGNYIVPLYEFRNVDLVKKNQVSAFK